MCISNTEQRPIPRADHGVPHGVFGDQSPTRASEAQPSLETIAKSVRQISESNSLQTEKNPNKTKEKRRHDGRAARFRHQRHAAHLLGGRNRVRGCRWSVSSLNDGVDLVTSNYGDGSGVRAHYEGLQTCGSVWHCPCCGARISETRREELGQLLRWARSQGLHVNMLTMTARHGRDDDLSILLDGMKNAKQRWARHRSYRNIRDVMVGSVTATEVTGGGQHGWHPHFHVIVVTTEAVDWDPLRDAWLASLRGAGLDGTGSGWDVRDAREVGTYIAKWGAAEELALAGQKKGRAGGGMTPAQLLAASCDDGDGYAGLLWSEYARVFQGRRQLVWSRGLKSLAGIDDVDDQEAAADERQEEQVEEDRANISSRDFREHVANRKNRRDVADRRAYVLSRAEELGASVVAAEIAAGALPSELAADDAELAELIEDEAPAPVQSAERQLTLDELLALEHVDNGEQSPAAAPICRGTTADTGAGDGTDGSREAGAATQEVDRAGIPASQRLGSRGSGRRGSPVCGELAGTCPADRPPPA